VPPKGYIDLHVHGLGRFDTRTTVPGELLKLAASQARAGVSAILPAIYSGPVEAMRSQMAAVCEAMRIQRAGAKILGLHLEGPFLSLSRAGAQDAGTFLRPTLTSLKSLIGGFEGAVKVMTLAPELPGALKVIERCTSLGIRVNMGHSDATYAQAMEGKRAGAAGVTHLFNAMRPFHHREPGLAGAGLLDEDLYAEVIPDGVHLSAEVLRMVFKTKPEGRIILVSDAVKGPQYKKGVLQGGAISLARGAGILRGLGIGEKAIGRAARTNPARYLKGA
jgi:N-acetylglucosamine-6-phosphate deacetylase